jgi:hypothetical protein
VRSDVETERRRTARKRRKTAISAMVISAVQVAGFKTAKAAWVATPQNGDGLLIRNVRSGGFGLLALCPRPTLSFSGRLACQSHAVARRSAVASQVGREFS